MTSAPPNSASAPPASSLDRRTLLKSGALLSGLAAAPLAATSGGRGFTHGVASGEPTPRSVLLWTRFAGAQDTQLTYVVREMDANRRVVAEGTALASSDTDWCAKAAASGLEPGRWYTYQFAAPDGSTSAEGRTRTLPVGDVSRFRMAVFSCSNKGFGWFNAYAHAADANEFDLVLHLGDYFYEYGAGTYPDAESTIAGREISPTSETLKLADYRARFASYRADPDLQRLHQIYPMVLGWDDHETANDSWSGGAENHDVATEGTWRARTDAATRAYREWLPVSDEPWAAYEIGQLATLFRLETRLTNRSEQFDIGTVLRGGKSPDEMMAALAAFREGAYRDPSREMLGQAQQDWLANGSASARDRTARPGRCWRSRC